MRDIAAFVIGATIMSAAFALFWFFLLNPWKTICFVFGFVAAIIAIAFVIGLLTAMVRVCYEIGEFVLENSGWGEHE